MRVYLGARGGPGPESGICSGLQNLEQKILVHQMHQLSAVPEVGSKVSPFVRLERKAGKTLKDQVEHV